MADAAELRVKFYKAIKSDRTVMLGLAGVEDGLGQPMTAQLDKDAESGPLYIFTAKDTDLVQALGERGAATAHFVSKDHDLFAAIEGELSTLDDPAMIDRLWSPFVAAWFKGGQDDPNLQLLRFDPGRAQIWLNEHSLFAGARMLLGRDPKEDYKEKVGEVRLS